MYHVAINICFMERNTMARIGMLSTLCWTYLVSSSVGKHTRWLPRIPKRKKNRLYFVKHLQMRAFSLVFFGIVPTKIIIVQVPLII